MTTPPPPAPTTGADAATDQPHTSEPAMIDSLGFVAPYVLTYVMTSCQDSHMTTKTSPRTTAAVEFIELTHMCDWIYNERRSELAAELGLSHPWQSHAAYLEARGLAGLSA